MCIETMRTDFILNIDESEEQTQAISDYKARVEAGEIDFNKKDEIKYHY